jgi:hypothetical protein
MPFLNKSFKDVGEIGEFEDVLLLMKKESSTHRRFG